MPSGRADTIVLYGLMAMHELPRNTEKACSEFAACLLSSPTLRTIRLPEEREAVWKYSRCSAELECADPVRIAIRTSDWRRACHRSPDRIACLDILSTRHALAPL